MEHLQSETPDIADHAPRFFAWFGILYATLALIQSLGWWQIFLPRNLSTRILGNPPFFYRAVIEMSSILLLIGCIRLLLHRTGARTTLLVWAIFVIAMEMVCCGAVIHRFGAGSQPLIPFAARQFLLSSLSLGFPLMVLSLMSIRRAMAGSGFTVIAPGMELERGETTIDSGAFSRELFTWTSRIALLMGALGVAFAILQAARFGFYVPYASSAWRGALLAVIFTVQPYSACLLLGGAILLMLRRAMGRRMVLGWAITYLLLTLAGLIFYDALYMYWQVLYSPMPRRYFFDESVDRIYAVLKPSAFAVIALYLLRQPQIAAEAGDVHPPQRTPLRVVYDAGETRS